jgi:hypothetical protein
MLGSADINPFIIQFSTNYVPEIEIPTETWKKEQRTKKKEKRKIKPEQTKPHIKT